MNHIPGDLRDALAHRYELRRVIGHGGMATVYLGHDPKHRREVAVKVLRPELTQALGTARFLKEIEIAAQLTHPHVLPLYDSGDDGGFLYYVMPYVNGESLRDLLCRRQRLAVEETVEIVSKVADALTYAHRNGIVHRDIKPENILLSEGHPVVADFGIAKAVSSASGPQLTRTGFPLGTPGYMSPEQAAGGTDLDETTDVFSLACVCYEMLVGASPGRWHHGGGNTLDVEAAHREVLDAVPGHVEQALARAMTIDPRRRFATPTDFAEALRTPGLTPPRYDEQEVKEIIRYAADLEARQGTESGTVTIGSVEQLAEEVGISKEHVMQAARALNRIVSPAVVEATPTEPPPRSILGAPSRAVFERTIEGELPQDEHPALLAEIRHAVGFVGYDTSEPKTLTWSASKPQEAGSGFDVDTMFDEEPPDIRVLIVVRRGHTHVRVEQGLGGLAWGIYGGILGGVGAGGVALSITIGGLVLSLGPALVGAACGVFAGGAWALARTIYPGAAKRRIIKLEDLADRIVDHVEETVEWYED